MVYDRCEPRREALVVLDSGAKKLQNPTQPAEASLSGDLPNVQDVSDLVAFWSK